MAKKEPEPFYPVAEHPSEVTVTESCAKQKAFHGGHCEWRSNVVIGKKDTEIPTPRLHAGQH